MNTSTQLTRRDVLAGTAATALFRLAPRDSLRAADPVQPKSIAAVITAYEHGLHADVLVGKILEGWKQDGGPGPALTLASMYVEQFTDRDMARPMAARHNVPLFDTIEGAVTVGRNSIPVDGVLVIGEHGDYPYNEKGQHLYPRRRFFEEVTDAFVKYAKVVPVFSDKHPGPVWDDAQWIYDRAQELNVPFMAGSSLAVTYQSPELTCRWAARSLGPSGSAIRRLGHLRHSRAGGISVAGRNADAGRSTGVEWVQCLQGTRCGRVFDDGTVPRPCSTRHSHSVGNPAIDPRTNRN